MPPKCSKKWMRCRLAELLRLEVLSPGEVLLRVDNVSKVIALTTDGQLGIFPGHTTMLAETVDGPLIYATENAPEQTLSFAGGILKVSGSSVVIFSGGFYEESQEEQEGVDLEQLEQEQQFSRLTTELTRRFNLS